MCVWPLWPIIDLLFIIRS